MIMLCFSKNTRKIRLASEAGLILYYGDILYLTLFINSKQAKSKPPFERVVLIV